MRTNTKKKHEMGKRFAILIGVAAVGVMVLGAQTGAQTPAPTPPGQAPPTCNGLPATIVGEEGRDFPQGTPGPDVIVDLGGGDTLGGGDGNDVLCGGPGRDKLMGDRGKDILLGEAGKDVLGGGRGKDLCVGGPGPDIDRLVQVAGGASPRWIQVPSGCEVEKSI